MLSSRIYGIEFTRRFMITNQPITRFAADLRQHGRWDADLALLAISFNPATVDSLMCRSAISSGWMGEVFDCDFNQMLKMQVRNGKPLFRWDVTPARPEGGEIQTGVHCLAGPPGCGCSCPGALS